MLSKKYYIKTEYKNVAVSVLKDALAKKMKEHGFGILTEIDVKKTMKEKIGKEYDDFLILGLCNPNFADSILSQDKDIALFLPCNALIYRNGENTVLTLVRAGEMLPDMGDSENAQVLAQKVEDIFESVSSALYSEFAA